jgi:hypothetical protein
MKIKVHRHQFSESRRMILLGERESTNFILSAAHRCSMLARSNAKTDIPVFRPHRM